MTLTPSDRLLLDRVRQTRESLSQSSPFAASPKDVDAGKLRETMIQGGADPFSGQIDSGTRPNLSAAGNPDIPSGQAKLDLSAQGNQEPFTPSPLDLSSRQSLPILEQGPQDSRQNIPILEQDPGSTGSRQTTPILEQRPTEQSPTTVPTASEKPQPTKGPTFSQSDSQQTGGASSTSASSQYPFIDNPLSAIDQPAYFFRFFVMNEAESFGIKAGLDNYSAFEKKNKIILAETGATGMNIKNVSIETVVGPNLQTKNANATTIKITIHEPMGISLLDKLIDTAKILSIRNYLKCPYFLMLKFHGYDQNGNYLDKIGPYGPNQRTWVWQINIANIDVQMSALGSIYEITAIPTNEIGLSNTYAVADDQTVVEAKNVKEVFDQYVNALNKADVQKYGYQRNFYEYEFLPVPTSQYWPKVNKPDPRTWELMLESPQSGTSRSASHYVKEALKRYAILGNGSGVEGLLEYVISNTKEAQLLARRETQDEKYGTAHENVVMFMCYADIKLNDPPWDIMAKDYNRKIKFYFIPYVSARSTTSDEQRSEITNEGKNKKKLSMKIEDGRLKKRYDFVFTGLNTEVINFDIKMNTLYFASVPLYHGWTKQTTQSWGPMVNELNHIKRFNDPTTVGIIKNLVWAGGALQAASAAVSSQERSVAAIAAAQQNAEEQANSGNEDSSIASMTADVAKNLSDKAKSERAALEKTTKALQEANRNASIAYSDAAKRNQAKAAETIFKDSAIYAEDLSPLEYEPLPITIDMETSRTQTEVEGVSEGKITVNRSMTAAVINQLTGSGSGDLLSIDLHIKGDPYWIGWTNVDAGDPFWKGSQGAPPPNNVHPNYRDGEENLVIVFRFPQGYSDSGSLILRNSEVFNGIYVATRVTSEFRDGIFEQHIYGPRDINIKLDKILK